MRKHTFYILSIFILLFIHELTTAEDTTIIKKNSKLIERYRYEALPVAEERDTRKETIEIELVAEGIELEYISKVISAKSIETIKIKMDREGGFISGERSISGPSMEEVTEEKIWRDNNKAYIERVTDRDEMAKEIDLPKDKMFAVDGSLLILLRSFPFESETQWSIFMIDFSGPSVTVSAHRAGIERITVPAGEFECYRIEVIVYIPIFRPTITYWITKEKPHFLVKNIGKRGPFTATYITSLVSISSSF